MNNKILNNLLNVKHLMDAMEDELNLKNLADVQKNIYYGFVDLYHKREKAKFEDIEKHPFCSGYSRVTIYRHINKLIEGGYIKKSGIYYLKAV